MNELIAILNEIRPDVDFENCSRLVDDGLLDSFDMITLVGELASHYEIEIGVENLVPEIFNSVEAILNLVQRLQDED